MSFLMKLSARTERPTRRNTRSLRLSHPARGEVLGVIEFFSREIRQPDQELLNTLATIGSQIGQFIERKRAEAELRESEQNYRMLFESIARVFARLKFCLTRTKGRSIIVFCKSARRLDARRESRMP
jgi:hypothetical protein